MSDDLCQGFAETLKASCLKINRVLKERVKGTFRSATRFQDNSVAGSSLCQAK